RAAQRVGFRTFAATPLLHGDEVLGVLTISNFGEPRPFTGQQLRLLETFASQAAIAIENARLFQELEQRNRDLGEALEQQTATSEILRAIASSPADLQHVFDAIITSALSLSHCTWVQLGVVEGDTVRTAAGAMTRSYPV